MEFKREILVSTFKEDKTFTRNGELFFNTQTHEIYWQDTEDISGINTEPLEGEDWIEVEPISHGEWHEAFKEWLDLIDIPEAYRNSIGKTLKALDQENTGLRQGWHQYQHECAQEKADEFIDKYKI